MKLLNYILFLVLLLTISSCLTFRTVEYVAVFNNDSNIGELTTTYTDIRSAEKDPSKQAADFEALIKMSQGDKFLLDQIEAGIYIRERKLFEKNGELNAIFTGSFEKLKIDGNALNTKGNERYLLIDIEKQDKIETNGKLFKTSEIALLVWPKGQKQISFKITKTSDEPTFPINQLYRDWLKK